MMGPITTSHIYPPIPVRQFDWCAYRDPERLPYGYGPTEDAAILDLLSNEAGDAEEADVEPYECDCGCRYAEAIAVLVCRKNEHGAVPPKEQTALTKARGEV